MRCRKHIPHLRVVAAILFLGAITSGCISVPVTQEKPQSGVDHPIAIGVCEDYPKDSRTLTNARRDLELLKTNHIPVLRISFSWLDMEPERGKFDWSFWDDFVRMAVDEYGVRLIPYICYTPSWAASSTNEDYSQQPPADNGSFTEFVKQIVARYKSRVHSWEIWNEPDNSYYWRGSAEQFAGLLAAGSRAVKETDPQANVVMGGLAWNLDFLQTVLGDHAAMTNVDVINLHNYYETWASDPLERIPDYVGRASDILHEHAAQQPIWLAEVGYSSFRHGAEVSGQYHAYFRDEHTPQAQAAALFRVMTLALSCTNVSLLTWYRIHDLPEKEEVIGDANNRHLGILDQHGRAKPALRALQFFGRLFPESFCGSLIPGDIAFERSKAPSPLRSAGALQNCIAGYRCIDGEVAVTKTISAPAEVHGFRRVDGTIIIVGWLKTYIPGSRGDDLSGDVPDKRRANVEIELSGLTSAKAKIFDELGIARGEVRVQRNGAFSHISGIQLRDNAVTVLEIPATR